MTLALVPDAPAVRMGRRDAHGWPVSNKATRDLWWGNVSQTGRYVGDGVMLFDSSAFWGLDGAMVLRWLRDWSHSASPGTAKQTTLEKLWQTHAHLPGIGTYRPREFRKLAANPEWYRAPYMPDHGAALNRDRLVLLGRMTRELPCPAIRVLGRGLPCVVIADDRPSMESSPLALVMPGVL